MGSGLSMTSVNKIKELANSREYSLALEIVDSQDLSKSLNPQFLRLCGEVYIKNVRYKDARRVLIMAHRIAPEAKRVIYSLVDLYLRVGYKELAKTYYDLYLFDADDNSKETRQLKYIYDKAEGAKLSTLEEYLASDYTHFMDYDWSFELFLLYNIMGNDEKASPLSEEYIATFKNSDNCKIIEDIISEAIDANKFFDVFSKESIPDNDSEQEDIREEEKKLLEADDIRIHPKEAEITIIFDDNEEPDAISKRRMKRLLKEQEKAESQVADSEITEDSETVDKKQGLFKKVFFNKKEKSEQGENSTNEAEVKQSMSKETETDEKAATEADTEAVVLEPEAEDESKTETVTETKLSEPEADEAAAIEIAVSEPEVVDSSVPETLETEADAVEMQDSEINEDFEMRELHLKHHKSKYDSVVSIETDDDFTAESETIDDLKDDSDYINPFDSISAIKKEKGEHKFVPKRKADVLFEDAEIAPEDSDDEFEVDDFLTEQDEEFGIMQNSYMSEKFNTIDEPVIEEEIEVSDEPVVEEEIEVADEPVIEEEIEVADEPVMEEEIEIADEPVIEEEIEIADEPVIEEEIEIADEPVMEEEIEIADEPVIEEEIEIADEPVIEEEIEIADEPVVEEEIEVADEPVVEEEIEVADEPVMEEEIEVSDEPVVEEEIEVADEPVIEEEIEVADQPVIEEEIEIADEPVIEDKFNNEVELDSEYTKEDESVIEPEKFAWSSETKKKKLDFPVFKSSLFPEYNQKKEDVENNFKEIMTEAQDKIQENILKEERMQREAVELLASLGISLDDISVTSQSYESIGEALYEGPSRDELKASLKIDSVKKNILKKLKENR